MRSRTRNLLRYELRSWRRGGARADQFRVGSCEAVAAEKSVQDDVIQKFAVAVSGKTRPVARVGVDGPVKSPMSALASLCCCVEHGYHTPGGKIKEVRHICHCARIQAHEQFIVAGE